MVYAAFAFRNWDDWSTPELRRHMYTTLFGNGVAGAYSMVADRHNGRNGPKLLKVYEYKGKNVLWW